MLATGALACKSPDWKDPKYVEAQLDEGSLKAFEAFTKLTEEQQRGLVPALVRAYNRGKDKDRAYELLKILRDPAAKEVYADVFKNSSDQRKRSSAAQALGDLKAKDQIPTMVQVFKTVPNETLRRSILEAFTQMPDAQQVPLFVEILTKYDPDTEPIAYHAYACDALAGLGQFTDTAVQAVVYGAFLDNPRGQNVYKECAAAVFAAGEQATPEVIKAYRGKLEAVNQRMTKYPTYIEGSSENKAVDMLNLLRDPKATDAIVEEIQRERTAPVTYRDQKLLSWGANRIQFFVYSSGTLGDLDYPKIAEMMKPFIFLEEEAVKPYKTMLDYDKRAKHDIVLAGVEAINRSGNRKDGLPVLAEAIAKADIKELAAYDPSFVYQSRWEAALNFARLGRGEDLETWDKLAKAEKEEGMKKKLTEYRPMLEVAKECGDQAACYKRHLLGGDKIKADKAAWELGRMGRGGAAEDALMEGLAKPDIQLRQVIVASLYRAGTVRSVEVIDKVLKDEGKSGKKYKDIHFRMKAVRSYLKTRRPT